MIGRFKRGGGQGPYVGTRLYEVNSIGQEKPVLIKILLGLVALMLAAGSAVAQETRIDQTPGLTEGDGDVATSAFAPIPTGYSVIYFFTGARTTSALAQVSSSVHCSNLLGVSTTVRVEVYGFDGFLLGFSAVTIPQYNTRTYSIGTQAPIFTWDAVITPTSPVNQGIIRVLKKGTGRIICAAQIHDTGNPPAFALPLVQYGPTGLH